MTRCLAGLSQMGYPTGDDDGSTMLKTLLHSPAKAFAFLSTLALLLTAIAAFAVSFVPDASFHVRPAGEAWVTVDVGGTALARFEGGREVLFIDREGRERLRAPLIAMVMEWEARGTKAENQRFFALRNELSRLVREPGVTVHLPDGRRLPAQRIDGSLGRMKASSWLSLGIGLVALMAGLWVVVLRPREWAAQTFLLSGIALLVATITMAVGEQMSIATSVAVQYWNGRINHLSAYMFGLSLVALFARYPFPLVPKRLLGGLAIALASFWAVMLLDPWRDSFGTGVLVVLALGIGTVVLAVIQGWKSRHDPALRAAFILIGGALMACIGMFSFVNLIPQMLGEVDVLPVPVATTVFLLFYLALAFAITRYRLFDLGGWAVHVATLALAVIFVLIVDLTLVILFGGTWTLSAAFLIVAVAWLPLRELLLRRTDRRRNRQDILLLRGASEVAFTLRPEEQAERWAGLLRSQFAPLTTEACTCATTEIREDGRVLAVPSPLGGSGLALGFAGQGNRLFNSDDRSVAGALVALVQEMVAARAAYDRGVKAERHRIARDLHDDVGARLMTTLHRDDLGTVHADVREAMADMRLIIDGMEGQTRSLSGILADLRHETVHRLELASIHAIWPVSDLFDDERPVPARVNRALFSVVRELVSNIIRHAGASRADFSSSLEDAVLRLRVHDDGGGFDSANSVTHGNGLRNIRRRLDEVGGSMHTRADGDGTTTRISLPVASPDLVMAGPAATM